MIKNSAGRLHGIFKKLAARNGRGCSFEEFSAILQVMPPENSVSTEALAIYALMIEEFETLKQDIDKLSSNKHKQTLYLENLADIEKIP